MTHRTIPRPIKASAYAPKQAPTNRIGSILVQGLAYFFLRAAAVPTGALHVRLLALQLRIIDSSLPVHVVRHRMQ